MSTPKWLEKLPPVPGRHPYAVYQESNPWGLSVCRICQRKMGTEEKYFRVLYRVGKAKFSWTGKLTKDYCPACVERVKKNVWVFQDGSMVTQP